MKACRAFLAALSTVVLFWGSRSAAAPGMVPAADTVPRVPAIVQGLAQNRPQQTSPRQRQPLPLPPREFNSPLAYLSFETPR